MVTNDQTAAMSLSSFYKREMIGDALIFLS